MLVTFNRAKVTPTNLHIDQGDAQRCAEHAQEPQDLGFGRPLAQLGAEMGSWRNSSGPPIYCLSSEGQSSQTLPELATESRVH